MSKIINNQSQSNKRVDVSLKASEKNTNRFEVKIQKNPALKFRTDFRSLTATKDKKKQKKKVGNFLTKEITKLQKSLGKGGELLQDIRKDIKEMGQMYASPTHNEALDSKRLARIEKNYQKFEKEVYWSCVNLNIATDDDKELLKNLGEKIERIKSIHHGGILGPSISDAAEKATSEVEKLTNRLNDWGQNAKDINLEKLRNSLLIKDVNGNKMILKDREEFFESIKNPLECIEDFMKDSTKQELDEDTRNAISAILKLNINELGKEDFLDMTSETGSGKLSRENLHDLQSNLEKFGKKKCINEVDKEKEATSTAKGLILEKITGFKGKYSEYLKSYKESRIDPGGSEGLQEIAKNRAAATSTAAKSAAATNMIDGFQNNSQNKVPLRSRIANCWRNLTKGSSGQSRW
jgi:hypothetical protein